MRVENCTVEDKDEIFRLYTIAANYQRSKKTVVVWPQFDEKLVATEIAECRQWKLIMDKTIACVWATTFSDAQIWEERNGDAAVYIHRIATNPELRGNNFVSIIVEWAKNYANIHNKNFIRLDTLGNNKKLIDHYCKAGFDFLGFFNLKNTVGLPDHYQTELPACLFEIRL